MEHLFLELIARFLMVSGERLKGFYWIALAGHRNASALLAFLSCSDPFRISAVRWPFAQRSLSYSLFPLQFTHLVALAPMPARFPMLHLWSFIFAYPCLASASMSSFLILVAKKEIESSSLSTFLREYCGIRQARTPLIGIFWPASESELVTLSFYVVWILKHQSIQPILNLC